MLHRNCLVFLVFCAIGAVFLVFGCATSPDLRSRTDQDKINVDDKKHSALYEIKPILRPTFEFVDADTNGVLETGESGNFKVTLKNVGHGMAPLVRVKVSTDSKNQITITPQEQNLGHILPDLSEVAEFSITGKDDLEGGALSLNITIIVENEAQVPVSIMLATKGIPQPKPLLELSLIMVDADGNGILDAGETTKLEAALINKGRGIAENVTIKVISSNNKVVLADPEQHMATPIHPQQIKLTEFDIQVADDITEGETVFEIQVSGQNIEPTITTFLAMSRQELMPDLRASYRVIDANENGALDAGEKVRLAVLVTNSGAGQADNVIVKVSKGRDKGLIIAKNEDALGTIKPGESKEVFLDIRVADDVMDHESKIQIYLYEKRFIRPMDFSATVVVRSHDPETRLYFAVKKNRNYKACDQYLTNFSNGSHIDEVLELCEVPIWNRTNKSKLINDYEHYLSRYPSGQNSDAAKQKIAEFKAIQSAEKLDTYEAYENFYQNFPTSDWASEARKRANLQYWQEKLRQDPKNAHNLCQVAMALVKEQGETAYNKALEYYAQAGNSEAAYIGIAEILMDKREYAEARGYLFQALNNGYDNHKIHYLLGRIYEKFDQTRKAIKSYNKAIEQNPVCTEYYYTVAVLYRRNLQYKQANKNFKKVIDMAPHSRDAKHANEYLKKSGF